LVIVYDFAQFLNLWAS